MGGFLLVLVVHTIHVLLAGAWLGGILFTTFVVSPALKAMKWGEAQRVGVRAAIGRRYARVGTANLAFLALFAVADGILDGFEALLYAECALILALFGLVAAHGAVFGRRLAGLAEAELGAESAGEAASFARRRRGLQELSVKVSWLNLVVSVAVMVLAVNA
jgi:uncharacterized membrane protein